MLDVDLQVTYLIRATFYYGNWKSPVNVTGFNVYLNGNKWVNLVFDTNAFTYPATYLFEAVVYMSSRTLNVCLVGHTGTPFISSLQLRRMSSGMYLSVVGNHKYMGLTVRINAGARKDGLYLRSPDDEYDRIWTAPGEWDKLQSLNTTSTSPNALKEKPPDTVMRDAWYTTKNINYWHTYSGVESVGQVATYSYFQEIEANSTSVRGMQYFINDLLIDTFNLTSAQPYEVSSCILDVYDRNNVTIKLTRDATSELNPILNAFEIYLVHDWNESSTVIKDVASIERVKTVLNLGDWTGDPCVPVPYDWLGCRNIPAVQNLQSADNQTITAVSGTPIDIITKIDLSNTGLSSYTGLNFSEFENLTTLDLSSNNFSGKVRTFVNDISLKSLRYLNAARNSLEGNFPLAQLCNTLEFPNLLEANFDDNRNISGILDLTSWRAALKSFNASKKVGEVLEAGTPTPTPSTEPTPGFPTISLRNTNIDGIRPTLEELTPDIETFLRSFQKTADFSPIMAFYLVATLGAISRVLVINLFLSNTYAVPLSTTIFLV